MTRSADDRPSARGAAIARWGPTLLRWYVAATFLGFHGRHKAQELIVGNRAFVETVAALGFPAPAAFAALAVGAQLGAGLCLLLGLATRPAAVALASTMVVAVIDKWPLGFLALEPALTYIVIAGALTLTGAGAVAMDTRLEQPAWEWFARHARAALRSCRRFGISSVILLGIAVATASLRAPAAAAQSPSLGAIELGGEVRLFMERYGWEDFGVDAIPRDAYLLQRYMLHARLSRPTIWLAPAAFLQLKSGLASGREGSARPADVDRLDVHQAYVEVGGAARRRRVALRLGRQELFYGSARLINFREGENVRQSFDAVRLSVSGWAGPRSPRQDQARVDIFVASPAMTRRGVFDDGIDRTRTLWGAYAAGLRVPGATKKAGLRVDGYYIGHWRRGARFDQNASGPPRRELRHTLGTRLWGAVALNGTVIDYNWEPMLQFGAFGDGPAAGRIRAWTLATETGVRWPHTPLSPRISLRADVASGDRDRDNADLQTFHPLYPRGDYFGLLSPVGPANVRDLHPRLEVEPWRGASLSVEWLVYWRDSAADGVYNPVGVPLRTGARTSARFVGHQPGVELEWEVNRRVTLLATAGAFVVGPYVRETAPASARRNITYLGGYAAYRF
ncbi:alginate export family protein [Gemmatimonas groenlandica]|uniref:Alginate export family protein n=1 Tax=Gemmatimonas groenlandica TaxID=2732249 RepID=A0A6M4IM11_9BACT|nr:alginate export family protein [Gemmatimonas groenlandica]QJR34052.1 alginate export family protein [Gemmatimonas groenlandica]